MHSLSEISSTARSNSQGEHVPFEIAVDDDKQSTISQDSIPRAEHALEALQLVAGNRVRHARCAPEFLEEVAGAHFKKFTSRKFKIIASSEARSFFKNYIIEHNQKALRTDNDNLMDNQVSPVVFAVTVWEAGSKCVDYYMTWRRKTKHRNSKGKHPVSFHSLFSLSSKTIDFGSRIARLDSEFRLLAKALDKEFKRISSLKKISLSPPMVEKKTRFNHKSRPPPNILPSTQEQETSKLGDSYQPHLPEPPVSATDSVISLPLLNMVRGVPFSHRVPLRVTNPDRMSIISEIDVLVMGPTNTSQSLTAAVPDSSNTLNVPVTQRSCHKIADEDVKNSSASIRSSYTRSSKSSMSSQSSYHSEENHASWQASPEEKEKDEYKSPEFLIVFLGAKLDRDPTSWHGLEKQSSIRSLPADRHSPWISPLARPDSIHNQNRQYVARTSFEPDSDQSGDEGGWRNSPVIPIKPMMEAMGIIPNTAYFRPAPVIPTIQYHPLIGNTGSPAPHQSPYLYSSPHLDSSPYIPTWSPPMHVLPNGSPLLRPPSQAYSAAYASPYLQTHNSPF